MDELAAALAEVGGAQASLESSARLGALLGAELERGKRELREPRSGREQALAVAVTGAPEGVRIALPVPVALRVDPDAASERAWLMTAAAVAALVQADAAPETLRVGDRAGRLVLEGPGAFDPDLAALAFDEQVEPVDRLRARALVLPAFVLADTTDMREPPGPTHPLRVAARVAALGGRPADVASLAAHEDAVLAELERETPGVARPHEDPDPVRRVARRILQRLNRMGKWGGYHTEFPHLARGFEGNDRALAEAVGEALLNAGLLRHKRSVGQRHVFLNPRRAGEIHAFIDDGEVPPSLRLPEAG